MSRYSKNLVYARHCALVVTCLGVAGCNVGPKYARPQVEPAPAFRTGAATTTPAVDTISLADLPWWELFNDPQLQTLVNQALRNNYDVQVAIARIEQARALVGVASSENKPQVGYNATAGGAQTAVALSDAVEQAKYTGGTLGINAFWEFDVWGRIRSSTEAARANLFQQEDIRRGIQLALVTDLAAAYFRLLALDRELVIADSSRLVFQRNVELFTLRFEAGRDTRLPVERAQANLDNSRDRIAELRQMIGIQENIITNLTGANPGPVARGRALGQQTMPATPLGQTTALLQRRPDIRAAEQSMINANAQVGVAAASFFPKIGLSAFVGGQGVNMSNVINDTFGLWNIAGTVAGPLFTGGRLRENQNNRKAYWDETVAQYRKTITNAFQETSNALIAQRNLVDRRTALESRVAALQRSVELANIRYDAGRAAYFEVLEAEQQLFPAQFALAQVQRDQLIAVVNLYKALGGGWQLQGNWTGPGQ
jgi:multidrug efflux system outer membrane protein